jgi:iron(III) transport system substrate-binding protein
VRSAVAVLIVIWLAAGCEKGPAAGHIVVYAYEDTREERIEELFAEFTAETGVLVTPKFGTSAGLTDAVVAKQDSPRADVLLTAGAADIWRAADNGALRPLDDATLQIVPAPLRDPDGYWIAATAYMPSVIVSESATPIRLDTPDDLGRQDLEGRLCLSSSSLPGNRALLAALIELSDNRMAERMVRRWVRNLAVPPLETEAQLVDAVRSGRCQLGVTTMGGRIESLSQAWPGEGPRSLYIDGIGVARHATDADAAQRFVAWIAGKRGITTNPGYEFVHAGVAGRRDEEVRLLAERVGYR